VPKGEKGEKGEDDDSSVARVPIELWPTIFIAAFFL
jgi:hypothetical protein